MLHFNKVISWKVNIFVLKLYVIFILKQKYSSIVYYFWNIFIIFTNNNNFNNRKYIVKYYFHFIYLFHLILKYISKIEYFLPISI